MSASSGNQPIRQLKPCLPRQGLRWKSRSYVLRSPARDRRVMLALREKGIRLRAQDIEAKLCSIMTTAKDLARRGEVRNAASTYEFVLAVRRNHQLGRHMIRRLFVEFFRALINARRRYLRNTNSRNRAREARSQLAAAIDRFLRVAGAHYSDAEIFLRLNDEADGDV